MSGALAGRICLVAGASRGVGRGVARALGEAGATVIVTARSSEAGARTDQRRETIEDTARLVDEAGGKGTHYVCDHANEREVDQLASWALRRFGRVDALVSAVWSGNEGYDGDRYPDGSSWGTPFWRRPTALLGAMFESAIHAQLLTARAFAPAMVAAKRGLMIFVAADDDGRYLGDAFYDLAENATARLAFAAAADLRPFGVTALTLAPGRVRTERAQDAGLDEGARESPLYAGRAAAALIAEKNVAPFSGRVLHAAELAEQYGFADEDGRRPARLKLAPTEET
ncbi:MAG: short-chain dehydrogenase [Rhizobiales bacterium 65-9]|nr:SDR family NAD(P)-dependent oxidoreductase [Hyphomicrobiales bacterium]OJY38056.1 MAG: short-chain dehydrogenase [Rhizobiales bacterium 65-9]